jgi:hypothetical protein
MPVAGSPVEQRFALAGAHLARVLGEVRALLAAQPVEQRQVLQQLFDGDRLGRHAAFGSPGTRVSATPVAPV